MNTRKIVLSFAAVAACAFGAFADGEMPKYKHAEYITLEPSGGVAASFDTGIKVTESMELRFKFMMEGHANYAGAIKDFKDENSITTRIIYNNTSTTGFLVHFMSKASGGGTAFSNVVTGPGETVEGFVRKGSARLNGVKGTLKSTAGTANEKNLTFASAATSKSRIYSFQVVDVSGAEPVLIREFVPAYDPETDECGFWDGTTLLTETSAGTLSHGPEGSGLKIDVIGDQPFDHVNPVVVTPVVRDAITGAIIPSSEYDVSFADNTGVGVATVTVTRKTGAGAGKSVSASFNVVSAFSGSVYYATPNPTYDPETGAEVATSATTVGGVQVEAWSITNAFNRYANVILLKGTYDYSKYTSGDPSTAGQLVWIDNKHGADQLEARGETGNPDDVVIVGPGLTQNMRCFYFQRRVSLSGMTIRDFGCSGSGGAVWFTPSSTGAVFSKCKFFGNTGLTGGAVAGNANLQIEDCLFISNRYSYVTTTSGQGGGGAVTVSKCLRCTFVENGPVTTDPTVKNHARGGATWASHCTNCVFIGNRAWNGGAAAGWTSVAATCYQCAFTNNVTFASYGVVADVDCERCDFYGNEAAYVIYPTKKVSNCNIISNHLSACVVLQGTLKNCLVARNRSEGNNVLSGSNFENCLVASNVSKLRVVESCKWAANTVFTDNCNEKGNLVTVLSGSPACTNCVADGNVPTGVGEENWTKKTTAEIKSCYAFDDNGVPTSLVRNGMAKKILLDKGFDLGQTAEDLDLAGKPRVFNDIIDIGCWEWPGPFPGLMLILR